MASFPWFLLIRYSVTPDGLNLLLETQPLNTYLCLSACLSVCPSSFQVYEEDIQCASSTTLCIIGFFTFPTALCVYLCNLCNSCIFFSINQYTDMGEQGCKVIDGQTQTHSTQITCIALWKKSKMKGEILFKYIFAYFSFCIFVLVCGVCLLVVSDQLSQT